MKKTHWLFLIILAFGCDAELDETELQLPSLASEPSSSSTASADYIVATLDSLKKVVEDYHQDLNRDGTIKILVNSNIDITASNHNLLPINISTQMHIHGLGNQTKFIQGEITPAFRHQAPYVSDAPIFEVNAQEVSFYGLKFKGPIAYVIDPLPHIVNKRITDEPSVAIIAKSQHTKIEHCEFYYWNEAIRMSAGHHSIVRKNYIHYNTMHELDILQEPYNAFGDEGEGYGILVSENTTNIQIIGNVFSGNRHDVSSNGFRHNSYLARYNVIVGNSYNTNFDVHSEGKPGNETDIAGNEYYIENNIWFRTTSSQRAVAVRGTPQTKAVISGNYFETAKKYFDNEGNQNFYPAYVQVKNDDDWEHINANSHYLGNYFSFPISGGIGNLLKGNFDSDLEEELLLATGESWFVADHPVKNEFLGDYPSQIDATTDFQTMKMELESRIHWKFLVKVNIPASEIRVGNFDNDKEDEIFHIHGGNWNYFDTEDGTWNVLKLSSYSLDRMIFGDVSGNGKTDILCYSHGDSKLFVYEDGISYNGYSISIPTELTAEDFLIGDFNGDGKDELFKANDVMPNSTGTPSLREWEYYDNDTGKWVFMNSSIRQVNKLGLGNFESNPSRENNLALNNNPNIVDVFSNVYDNEYNRNEWKFTVDGRSNWKYLNQSNYDVSNLLLLRFDGDEYSDAISVQNGSIAISRNCQEPWTVFLNE